jgi:hypothetical protein
MPSTYDPLLRLELQATGENATTWGTKTNNNLDLIAAAIAGQSTLTLTSGNVSLTTANAAADQARSGILVLQGTLVGNVNVIVPTQSKTYAVVRQTTGAYDITFKNASGTGAVLPATGNEIIVCTTATCVGLLGSLSSNVSTLETRVANVSASVSALNVQLAAVSSEVSATKVQINTVSAALTSANNVVSALEVRVSAVSAQASAIQAQVNAVSALVSVINALNIRITE